MMMLLLLLFNPVMDGKALCVTSQSGAGVWKPRSLVVGPIRARTVYACCLVRNRANFILMGAFCVGSFIELCHLHYLALFGP